jgi:K+ transporter
MVGLGNGGDRDCVAGGDLRRVFDDQQAIQLGFLPRVTVVQTSASERGQAYIPGINWLPLAAVLAAVIGFGSSSRLASAYGIAVTATMTVDTLLTFFVVRHAWGYPLWLRRRRDGGSSSCST